MNDSKISVRYANALFDLAHEKKILEEVVKDMKGMAEIYEQSPEFKQLIKSPVVDSRKKHDLLEKAVFSGLNSLTGQFMQMLFNNKREAYIYPIALSIIDMYRKQKGIVPVTLTSAVPLNNVLKDKIISLVKNNFKSEVELEEKIKPGLLGGFILKINDIQYNSSVANQLKNLRLTLLEQKN